MSRSLSPEIRLGFWTDFWSGSPPTSTNSRMTGPRPQMLGPRRMDVSRISIIPGSFSMACSWYWGRLSGSHRSWRVLGVLTFTTGIAEEGIDRVENHPVGPPCQEPAGTSTFRPGVPNTSSWGSCPVRMVRFPSLPGSDGERPATTPETSYAIRSGWLMCGAWEMPTNRPVRVRVPITSAARVRDSGNPVPLVARPAANRWTWRPLSVA